MLDLTSGVIVGFFFGQQKNICSDDLRMSVDQTKKCFSIVKRHIMVAENVPPQTGSKCNFSVLPIRNPRTVTVPERFNMDRLQIAAALSEDDLEAAKIKSYIKSAPNHCLYVHYEDPGVGRLTATAKGEPSCVQMTMNGHFRAAACQGLYHDVDIEDCAMTILIQVCQAHELPCAAMQTFSRERKEVLLHLQSQGMSRKQAKGIQNRCVFGGRIDRLQEKYDIPQCILNMREEVQQITPQLLTLYPVFCHAAVEKHGSSYWNVSKSCMIERKHMEQLFSWGIASGPYGFILITNEPDGRARVRINGNQEVHGIV
jgi:hypothetical protein